MATLSRRNMLKGSALALGGTLCGPLLRHVWAGPTTAARVVLVVEGNGVFARAFGSSAARAAINAVGTKQLTATDFIWHQAYGHTKPLVVTSDPLTTPSGSLAPLSVGPSLVNKSAVVLGLSSTVAGGGHSTFRGALSCTRGSSASIPAATIDAVLASSLKGMTPFDAVRLGIDGSNARLSYAGCVFAPGRPAPIILDPTDAYNKLFSIVARSSPTELANRSAMLDFAKADVNAALGTFGGSSAERAKLEGYLAAVEDVRARQAKLSALTGVQLPSSPATNAKYQSADPIDQLEVHFELAKAALLGALTNVVVLFSGPGGGLGSTYTNALARHLSGNDLSLDRHRLQHAWMNGPEYGDTIMDVTSEHVRLVGGLARALDAVPEGSGTMLDHTIILYMSENGEQHHSRAEEWPMLLVGGKALGFKTDGRTVVYPRVGKPENRQVSNMFNTLGHATGNTALNTFGGEGPLRIAQGPLGSEIFI